MRNLFFSGAFLFALIITSCSPDFNLNAPWKNIPVVYSLLNINDSVQYVRLNKAFLGEADAFLMAQSHDSLYYDTASVFLELYDLSYNPDKLLKITELQKVYLPKDSGIFNSDSNFVYKMDDHLVAQSNTEYRLRIQIPQMEDVTASTTLVSGLTVAKPTINPLEKIGFAYFGSGNEPAFNNYICEWVSTPGARLYGLTIRFHWREFYENGSQADLFADWVLPTKRSETTEGNVKMVSDINGQSFYQFVNNSIQQGNPETKRQALNLEFTFTVAGDELATYMDVNGPSNGIIQERPAFTNISGGVGVFSSRFNKTITGKLLSDRSIDVLSCGPTTAHLRFADFAGQWDCLNN